MKRVRSFVGYSLLALLVVVSFSRCKKEQSAAILTEQEEQQIAIASGFGEGESQHIYNGTFDNVMGASDQVGMHGTGVFGRTGGASGLDSLPPCATVTYAPLNAPNVFPLRITIDFGPGCTCQDGRTRSGKINTIYTGRLIEPNNSATTTFESYKIDSISITGTHTVHNTSSGSNARQFTVSVQNARLSKPNGNYTEWNSTRVLDQVEGLNTPNLPGDDIFNVTGSATGTSKRGSFVNAWESHIVDPLRKRFNCHWITKGTVQVSRVGLPVNSPYSALLDYGQGLCDNNATLTVNGNTYNVQLP